MILLLQQVEMLLCCLKKSVQIFRGLIQLAGGTNEKTHEFLKSNNLPDGIAFGSAARKIMQPLIGFAHKNNKRLYEYPERMDLAIKKAQKFLEPWKSNSLK